MHEEEAKREEERKARREAARLREVRGVARQDRDLEEEVMLSHLEEARRGKHYFFRGESSL